MSEATSSTAAPEAPVRRKRLSWRRQLVRLAVLLAGLYLVMLMVLGFFQQKLIFPGSWVHAHNAPIAVPDDAQLVHLDVAGGNQTVALWGAALDAGGTPLPVSAARRRPTILFFYGNGDHLAAYPDQFEAFRRLGANVCIPEYVGYGSATGAPSETNCYATADAAYDFVLRQPEVDPHKLIIMGWSLGSGVAADLAARHGPQGLILMSAYTSIVACAQSTYFFLPCKLMVRHRFMTIDKIGKITCPIVLIHGTNDHTVPYWMSFKLKDAATHAASVEHIAIEGAHHNDIFEKGYTQIMRATKQMIDEVAQEAPATKSKPPDARPL